MTLADWRKLNGDAPASSVPPAASDLDGVTPPSASERRCERASRSPAPGIPSPARASARRPAGVGRTPAQHRGQRSRRPRATLPPAGSGFAGEKRGDGDLHTAGAEPAAVAHEAPRGDSPVPSLAVALRAAGELAALGDLPGARSPSSSTGTRSPSAARTSTKRALQALASTPRFTSNSALFEDANSALYSTKRALQALASTPRFTRNSALLEDANSAPDSTKRALQALASTPRFTSKQRGVGRRSDEALRHSRPRRAPARGEQLAPPWRSKPEESCLPAGELESDHPALLPRELFVHRGPQPSTKTADLLLPSTGVHRNPAFQSSLISLRSQVRVL